MIRNDKFIDEYLSPRRPPVVEGPPGLGCSMENHPFPPPHSLDPMVGRSLPVSPAPSLRSAGIRLGRRSGVVTAQSVTFYFSSCARPYLTPLCASAPPPSLPRPCLFFVFPCFISCYSCRIYREHKMNFK